MKLNSIKDAIHFSKLFEVALFLKGELIQSVDEDIKNVNKSIVYLTEHYPNRKEDIISLGQKSRYYSQKRATIERDFDLINDEKIFKLIIKKFNLKIKERILNGYSWTLGFGLGKFFVHVQERRPKLDKSGNPRLPVNWPQSNRNKKKILESGRTPFAVTKRSKDGRPLENNGGTHWQVYFNDRVVFRLLWVKGNRTIFNINNFTFKFAPQTNADIEGIAYELARLPFEEKVERFVKDSYLLSLCQ